MTTRHPTSRRVHQEHAESEDAFIAKLLELVVWAKGNSQVLIGAFAVVMLAGAAGLYYRTHQANVRQQAAIELAEVRQTVMSGNRALAIRDLEAFIAKFGGTGAEEEARLTLAQVYLEDGQAQKAAESVSALASKPNSMTRAGAAFLLAAAQEGSNEIDRAEATYLRIADTAEMPFQRREALDQAARLRLERGDAAGAGQLYQQLLDTTPETAPEWPIYQMRLAEVRAISPR